MTSNEAEYGTDEPSVNPSAPEVSPGQVLSQKYRFTPDEIRALRECNRESFYYRCLPLGTTLGVGTYFAVRAGYLKPSVRFGAGPKMFVASILGYFLGKFSYQKHCVEKLMALPNSPLAEMLKKSKGRIGFQESFTMEPGFTSAIPVGTAAFEDDGPNESSLFTDVGDTRPIHSFDTSSSTFSGVDYGKSFDTTQEMLNDDNLPQKNPQFSTSYDDLRKRNRDEHEIQTRNTGLGTLGDPPGPSRRYAETSKKPPYRESQPYANKTKNIYGDTWEEKPE